MYHLLICGCYDTNWLWGVISELFVRVMMYHLIGVERTERRFCIIIFYSVAER